VLRRSDKERPSFVQERGRSRGATLRKGLHINRATISLPKRHPTHPKKKNQSQGRVRKPRVLQGNELKKRP